MKRVTMVILIGLVSICSYGQQILQLNVKTASELPLSAHEHFYLIEITNNSSQVQNFNIVAENAFCEDINRSKQSVLKQEILNAQKTGPLAATSISANNTMEFYVKISRQGNTKLSTFNCTSIRAVSVTNTDISNFLIINSFIPDPKNFN